MNSSSEGYAEAADAELEREFRLPDVGEGLPDAEIVNWRVQVGERVEVNQVLVEIETAKARVELPSPWAGVVTALLVDEGVVVPVGAVLIRIIEREAVLVGYGVRTPAPSRRPRPLIGAPPPQPHAEAGQASPQKAPADGAGTQRMATEGPPARPLAGPPVRALAKAHHIDLSAVPPTGTRGEVTRDDLARYLDLTSADPAPRDGSPTGTSSSGEPVRGVRAATARAMVASAAIPQASVWLDVDITRSIRLLRRASKRSAPGGPASPTLLALVARALVLVVAEQPSLTLHWVETSAGATLVTKGSLGLGIAVATGRGLLVPVVHSADSLGFGDLTAGIAEAVTKARAGSSSPAELSGADLSITNVGVFGVDGGVPLVPPGQTAILCLGRVAERAWAHRGRVRVRHIVTLVLSFDHRAIDGEQAARALARLGEILADPARALLA